MFNLYLVFLAFSNSLQEMKPVPISTFILGVCPPILLYEVNMGITTNQMFLI